MDDHEPLPLPRWHLAALLGIVLIGLARGTFWVLATEVTSPIDEAQHLDYVIELADDGEPPIVGRDVLDPRLTELLKDSPTGGMRSSPTPVDPDDPSWGAVAQSYEGVQPPLAYLLLTPAYLAARPFGILAVLFFVRATTVLVALAAIPLAYVLARESLPHHRAAWLGTPSLLVFVQGYNANLAAVTNDALLVVVATAALVPVARAIRRGPTWWQAVATGIGVGAALTTKATAVALLPLVALGAAIAWWRWRPRPAVTIGWSGVVVALTGLAVTPWLLWNRATYGAFSAAAQADAITGPLQPRLPVSLSGLVSHLRYAATGFWELQPLTPPWTRYSLLWFAALAVATAVGIAIAVLRRRWWTAAVEGWHGTSYAAAFVVMAALIMVVFGGVGAPAGRHLYVALVPMLVAIAGGAAIALRGRWAAVLLVAVIAGSTWAEVASVDRYLAGTYLRGVVAPDLVPVVEQTWSDGWTEAAAIRVAPPCRAELVEILFRDEPPQRLDLADGGSVALDQRIPRTGGTAGRYALPRPTSAEFTVSLPSDAAIGHSTANRTTDLALEDLDGDPVASLYCPVDDPAATRFAQRFRPVHPDLLTWGSARGWPELWRWATTGVLGISLVIAVAAEARSRRRTGEDEPVPDPSDEQIP